MNTHELTAFMQETRELVVDLTGLDSERINDMMFESAFAWLRHIGCDDHIANQFAATKEFWGFYKRLWHEADRDFIRSYYRFGLDAMPKVYYEDWHLPNSRAMNTHYAHSGYHSIIKTLAVR
jgi:hypothetical protein